MDKFVDNNQNDLTMNGTSHSALVIMSLLNFNCICNDGTLAVVSLGLIFW